MAPVDAGPPWPASRWENAFQQLNKQEQTHIAKYLHPGSSPLPNLLSDIETQIDHCEGKDHVLFTRDNGEEVKVRKSLASIAGHITKFKAIGDAAVSLSPGYASIPWAAVGFILQATVNDVNKFKQMREGVELVSKIAATYAETEKMSFKNRSNLKEQLSSAIIELYLSILKYLLGARVYYSKGRTKRWFRSFFEDPNATSELLKSIKEHETRAKDLSDKVAQEDNMAALESIHAGVGSVQDGVGSIQAGVGSLQADVGPIKESLLGVEARREKLLQQLKAPFTDARFDHARTERFGDTCNWILDNEMFQEWISEKPHQAQVMWIHGPPGFGKTFLSARVVDYLLDKFPGRVAHFFASDSDKSHDTNGILRSWIAQMINQSDETIPAAEKILLGGASHADTSSNSRLWPLFTSIAKALGDPTFVVDGFDECSPVDKTVKWRNSKARERFLHDLKESIQGTTARVLVVSRDAPDIRQGLSAFISSHDTRLYEHQITPKNTRPDIYAYSKDFFESALPNSENLRAQLMDQACEKSDGMFLWIQFLQEDIQSSFRSEHELESIIKEMPQGMDELYEKELSKIFDKSKSPRVRDRVAAIFRWVLYAVEPLTVAGLAEALILESEDISSEYPFEKLPACWNWYNNRVDDEVVENVIKKPCGSLVTLRKPDWQDDISKSTVHFVHFSVKEYLLRPRQDPPQWPDFADPARENMKLGRHCLRYLCFDYFGYDETESHEHYVEDDGRVTLSRQSTISFCFPFLKYAALHWHRHIYLEIERPPDVIEYEKKFVMSSNWKQWALFVEPVSETKNPSPIYYASCVGLLDAVKNWHSMGFSLTTESGGLYGFPLLVAAKQDRLDIAEYLLQNGVDVNQVSDFAYSRAALPAAADKSSTEMVRLLLDFGADPDQTDKHEDTALHCACQRGLMECVAMLVEAGSSLSKLNEYHESPIDLAAARGHYKVVEFLLGRKADLAHGNAKLLIDASINDYYEIVAQLLRHGALAPPGMKREIEAVSEAAAAEGEKLYVEDLEGSWESSEDTTIPIIFKIFDVEATLDGFVLQGYIDITGETLVDIGGFGQVSYDQSVRLAFFDKGTCEWFSYNSAIYDGRIETHKGKAAATMTLRRTSLPHGVSMDFWPERLTLELNKSFVLDHFTISSV